MFQKNNKLWDNLNSKRNQFKKGHISLNKNKTFGEIYGIIESNKIKEKINKSNKGKHFSPKTEFKKGHIPFIKGKTKENCEQLRKISELMKKNNPMKKIKINLGSFKKGHLPFNAGKTKENCEGLKKISELMKNGGALKARQGNNLKPNNSEKILIEIMKKNNFPFNYVGNEKIWFKGKTQYFNPDFISKNPKYIIELFGDYWHSKPEIIERDKRRLESYKRYGYKTLIIWSKELKKTHDVIKKVMDFVEK